MKLDFVFGINWNVDTRAECGTSARRDSRYSDGKLRDAVEEAAIPRRANQKRDVQGLLRVVKKFITYGSKDQKEEYHKRPHIEGVCSFLKTQYSITVNKVRGLGNVASYAHFIILCLVLNREAVENRGRDDKTISPPISTCNIGVKQRAKALRKRRCQSNRRFQCFQSI